MNDAGESERSHYMNVETAPESDESPPSTDPSDPPARPTGLSAEATSASVTLTCNDPGDASITHYTTLPHSMDGDAYGDGQGAPEFMEVGATEDAGITYVDTSVEARRKYVYRLKVVNAACEVGRSGYADAETPRPGCTAQRRRSFRRRVASMSQHWPSRRAAPPNEGRRTGS